MKKYSLLASLVLGLGLCIGCGDSSIVTDDAAPTAEEEAAQSTEMDESVSKAMEGGGGSDYPAPPTGDEAGSGADDSGADDSGADAP